MCENSDLGRQEPRGCRHIYGDPASEDWRFCQRTIAPGGRPGDPSHPPYCAWHTKVALQPTTEAAKRNFLKFLNRIAAGEEETMYDMRSATWQLVPTDVYVKINRVPLNTGNEDSFGARSKKHG
jgi:hypothetical protein